MVPQEFATHSKSSIIISPQSQKCTRRINIKEPEEAGMWRALRPASQAPTPSSSTPSLVFALRRRFFGNAAFACVACRNSVSCSSGPSKNVLRNENKNCCLSPRFTFWQDWNIVLFVRQTLILKSIAKISNHDHTWDNHDKIDSSKTQTAIGRAKWHFRIGQT